MDMEKEKKTSEENENMISFDFSSDDNTAEEVSFLFGALKTDDTEFPEYEPENLKTDNTEDEKKVPNKRAPINKREPVVLSSDIKEESEPEEITQAEKETALEVTEETVSDSVIDPETENAEIDSAPAEVSAAEEESPEFSESAESSESADETEEAPQTEDDDVVVFAAPEKPVRKTKIEQQRFTKKKSRFPVVPLAACVAVLCIAAVGAVMIINGNNSPSVANSDESFVSEEAKDAAASDREDSIEQTLGVLREESAEIKTINTASIVFGDNVTVSGVKVAGKTLSEAYDALQNRLKDLRDDINIEISCGSKNITLTQNDFEFDTDITNVLIQAYHYSRGELDNPTVPYADNGGVYDFTITSVINKNSVSAAVKKVAQKFDVQPQDAHVKSFNPEKGEKFTYAEGNDGYLISQKVVTEEINTILEKDEKKGGFSVKAVRTPYTKTLDQVKANTKLIGSHCTTANNVWASVFNMELAIKSCNGYVVKPGETFSFNKMTGDTTTGELGYVPSTAIVGGRYEQQYGGGICQASTTIFLAAMKAGMEPIERHAHQYASVYADRGLDATVDYGNLDMKFKNNYEYPVYIATYVYDYNGDGMDELCVEFYGPISAEFDEVVPVGWINYIGNSDYGAAGAQVYFKDGKEVKRVYIPDGPYDYHGESYYSLSEQMPSDPEYGPKNVEPTGNVPTVYSPNGCGSSAPVPYGTASQYLTSKRSTD